MKRLKCLLHLVVKTVSAGSVLVFPAPGEGELTQNIQDHRYENTVSPPELLVRVNTQQKLGFCNMKLPVFGLKLGNKFIT